MELTSTRLVIGRAADCQVTLPEKAVSRHHAEVFCDPFGRWWIHDLGSRNGTKVNGVPVVERILGLSDAVEIGSVALRLCRPASAEEYARARIAETMPVSERDFESITTLSEHEVPKVAAAQLSMLVEFGGKLLETEQADQRLCSLCRLMVSPEFSGRLAVALRLPKDRPGEVPQTLCEPVSSPGFEREKPYISKSVVETVRERDEPILASNAAPGPVDAELTISREEMPVSVLACPLRSDDRTMDFLYVMLPPEFGRSEWLALAVLAAKEFQQAESAWAARRQAEEYAAIERELQQARHIQMRLIPREVTVTGLDVAIGFEPCRWVGGDYVDVVPTPDGRVLLTVGDVCGKGLQAALVAASVHSMVHAGTTAGSGLRDLMQHLNEHLCGYLPDHSFVTMVAAMLDPGTGRVELVNSGHPPAVILNRGGGLRWLEGGANLPLGIKTAPVECHESRVGADEMLAMFTDGITESHGREGDPLGLEPLARKLGALYASGGLREARGVAEGLTSILSEIRGKELASDDQTFLLARRVETTT